MPLKSSTVRTLTITLTALLCIPAATLYTLAAIDNQAQPQSQLSAAPVPLVTVVPTRAASYRASFSAHGEVRAIEELRLSSQVSGRVVWRNPKLAAGDRVAAGDTLLRLDDTDYRVAVANATREEADALLALQQEQRQQEQARRDWQRAGLREPASALVLRKPQLRATQARLEAARVTLQQARRDLGETRIKAPFNAVVLSRSAGIGSYLSSGDTVAELRASDAAEIRVALSASQWQLLPDISAIEPVTIHNRDWPGVSWQGQAVRLAALIDPATRQRELIVRVDNPLDNPAPLLPGSFVSVRLQGAEQPDLLAIPASALGADGYLWYVQQGQLQRQSTTALFSDDNLLFVPRGQLLAPVEVVRRPLASFLPGTAVMTDHSAVSEIPASRQTGENGGQG